MFSQSQYITNIADKTPILARATMFSCCGGIFKPKTLLITDENIKGKIMITQGMGRYCYGYIHNFFISLSAVQIYSTIPYTIPCTYIYYRYQQTFLLSSKSSSGIADYEQIMSGFITTTHCTDKK